LHSEAAPPVDAVWTSTGTPSAPAASLPCRTLSVVVPARDEADNIRPLLAEVAAALDPLGIPWELIIVDDGSVDGTGALIAALAARDARVRPVLLASSRGQTGALLAGFRAARYEYVATLDADRQCPPADLPALLADMDGCDLACGVREARHDPPSRRLASSVSNAVRSLFLAPGIRDLACPLRVFRRDALDRVARVSPLFDGAHRWLPALFHLAGLRVRQRRVRHQPRMAGTSKYTTRGRILPIARELVRVLRVAAACPGRVRSALVVAGIVVVAASFLHGLGAWPLMEPDEGRNAEVAREMLRRGDWAVPHFNGLPYLDKPVLLFWAIAASFQLFGINEFAARLPSAVAAIALVALTFDLARLLVGRRRAILAAIVVATMPIVVAYGRLVIFDLPLTVFTTAALCCLARARRASRDRLWFALAGAAIGCAVLTKGPVGIAVPLLMWFAGRDLLPGRRRGWAGPLLGVGVVVLLVAPWVAVVMARRPDFLHYALVEETFLRLTSSTQFRRAAPPYFYLETLGWALGAWGILLTALSPELVRVWRKNGRAGRSVAFAVRATVALLVFFTLSASKRPHYILPAVVPLAILVAVAIDEAPYRAVRTVRVVAAGAALVGVAMLVAAAAGVHVHGARETFSRHVLLAAGGAMLGWGTVALALGRERWSAFACVALLVPALGLAVLQPIELYASGRSSRDLARQLGRARVVSFASFRTSLPFYLRRTVPVASPTAQPLTSNYLLAQPFDSLRPEVFRPRELPELLAGVDPPLVVTKSGLVPQVERAAGRRLRTVYDDGNVAVVGARR